MYAGDYLKEENNVGHEVINMFKTDSGENYIYVNPYGFLADEHYGQIDTVLLTRRINANKWEILAKATDWEYALKPDDILNKKENQEILNKILKKEIHKFSFCNQVFDEENKTIFEENKEIANEEKQKKKLRYRAMAHKLIHDEQVKEIESKGITYGGKYIYEILNKNQNNNYATYFTFKAKTFRESKEPIYILADGTIEEKNSNKRNEYFLSGVNLPKQSFKIYFPINTIKKKDEQEEEYTNRKKAQKKAYEKLQEIINNENLWKEENTSKKIDDKLKEVNRENKNFLQIIKKEEDELVFSNLLAHFFANKKGLFNEFVKEVLSKKAKKAILLKGELNVFREKENIDLWFEDDDNIIIIENKIKSKINGRIEKEMFINDKEYGQTIEEGKNEIKKSDNEIFNERLNSQLKKYFNIVDNIKCRKAKNFFLLTPNYNDIELVKYDEGNSYIKLYYEDVYNFFKNQLQDQVEYQKDLYMVDFTKAMKKHASPYNHDMYEEMERRFVKCIEQV